jgi:hypothetical protein
MFCTLEQYFENYRVRNDQVPSESVLNRGPFRLKREIRELKSLSDIVIGNDLETWNASKFYEQDEYIQYNGKIYRSRIDGNNDKTPGVSQDWILVQVVSLKDLLRRVEALEERINQ